MRLTRFLRAALFGVGVAFFVLLLAPTVKAASVSELTLAQIQSESLTILTFDDSSINLLSGYWDTKGVKFFSNKGKAIYVSSYNRGGEATASGEYAISNDAIYPNSSDNDPLFIEFKNPVKSVGFYYGNGSGSETATIRVYGKNNVYLGSLTKTKVTDPVTNFVGLTASEPITYISLDYGSSILSESIDSLVFSAAVATTPQRTCSETDNGNNKNLKGKNTIYNSDGSVFTSSEDYCKDSQTVTEITCNGGQWDVTYEACDGKCQDGQCLKASPTCSDTDGGIFYGVFGKTTGSDEVTKINSTYSDTCGGYIGDQGKDKGDYIAEKHCSGPTDAPYVHTQWYRCAYGCESGVCLSAAVPTQQRTCSETDNGNNKNLKGKNTIYNSDGSVFTSSEDYCKDSQTVTEITCNGGQWDVTYEACDGKCQDGQCVVATETSKPDLGLYGFLYIGKDRREVKWNETITLTPADTVYGSKTPVFDVYYTQKNYGSVAAYRYYDYLYWDSSLLATEYTSQLYTGSKSEIRERITAPTKTGEHTLKIKVDNNNTVNEEAESNNNFQVTVKLEGFDTPTYNLNVKPVIYQPEVNQTLTNYPRQAFLSWSSVKDANNYNIEVACDHCGASDWVSVVKYQSATTNYTTSPLAGDNQFRVRVQGVFPDGSTGIWSEWRYFRYDTSKYSDNGPRCSDVKGGNVTFLVCENYAVDHFWSGSKIYLDNFDQNGANVTLKNLSDVSAYLEKGKTYTYNVSNKPGKYIEVTYLGTGQWGRAVVKVDSNTVYEDSSDYQSYNQSSCVNRWGSDGLYNLCVGKTLYHNDGWTVTNLKQNSQYVWLKVKWPNKATKQIKVRLNTIKELDKPSSDESVDFSYVKYQAKSRALIRVETNYAESDIVADETSTTNTTDTTNTNTNNTNTTVSGNYYVNFGVGVNDYPDHKDYTKSKNLTYGYVNMYNIVVENGKFKVASVTRGQVSPSNGSYGASFNVAPGQIVDFAGFKTLNGAIDAANSKIGTYFTAPPPYKNFGNRLGTLCQTNWMDVNSVLRISSDNSESCANSLSTPYQDVSSPSVSTVTTPVPTCGDTSGGDGEYTLCFDNKFKHTGTGVVITPKLEKNDNYLQWGLDGTPVTGIGAEYSKDTVVLTNNKQLIRLVANKTDDNSKIRVKITTITGMSQGNLSGGDGWYKLFVGDSLLHNSTGVKFSPYLYVQQSGYYSHLTGSLSGAANSTAQLNDNQPLTVSGNLGRAVKMTFGGVENGLYRVKMEADTSVSCGNSSGGDGLYSGCIGDSINHTPTGLVVKIDYFNSSYANISFNSADLGASLKPGGSVTTAIKNGTKVKISFDSVDAKYGLFLRIETVK